MLIITNNTAIKAKIKIAAEGLFWETSPIYLYKNRNGKPSQIIPLIKKAYKKFIIDVEQISNKLPELKPNQRWRGGRSGKVASYLCAIDPGELEPSNSDYDVQYYYNLFIVNPLGGKVGDYPFWELEINNKNRNFLKRTNILNLKIEEFNV